MSFPPSPKADKAYYAQLECGARFLAAGCAGGAERQRHLEAAERYLLLGCDIGGGNR